jgi:hypothetical protein
MQFKASIEKDLAAVIAQMRKVLEQVRVIKLKRDLKKNKVELQSLLVLKILASPL